MPPTRPIAFHLLSNMSLSIISRNVVFALVHIALQEYLNSLGFIILTLIILQPEIIYIELSREVKAKFDWRLGGKVTMVRAMSFPQSAHAHFNLE